MAKQITLISFINGFLFYGSTGEICTLPFVNGNKYGICEKWSQCESARNSYKNWNIPPIYCQYDRNDPVICCESNDPIEDNKFEKYQQGTRISERKCKETYFPPPPPTTASPKRVNNNYYAFVGGIPAAPAEFRHMTAIGWKNPFDNNKYDYLCGGTLISPYFILTAAHCTSVRGESPNVAIIGGDNLNTSLKLTPIKEVHLHPGYQNKQSYNDIALLELENESFFYPACLWQMEEIEYAQATAIGYGHTTFGGKGSNELIKGDLNLYANEECKLYYQPERRLQNGVIDSQLCAGDPTGMKDTCQGDSGGPLMVKVNVSGKIIPYILGITSFGQGCAGGPPSIYTRVSSYLDWIESIVWPEN